MAETRQPIENHVFRFLSGLKVIGDFRDRNSTITRPVRVCSQLVRAKLYIFGLMDRVMLLMQLRPTAFRGPIIFLRARSPWEFLFLSLFSSWGIGNLRIIGPMVVGPHKQAKSSRNHPNTWDRVPTWVNPNPVGDRIPKIGLTQPLGTLKSEYPVSQTQESGTDPDTRYPCTPGVTV